MGHLSLIGKYGRVLAARRGAGNRGRDPAAFPAFSSRRRKGTCCAAQPGPYGGSHELVRPNDAWGAARCCGADAVGLRLRHSPAAPGDLHSGDTAPRAADPGLPAEQVQKRHHRFRCAGAQRACLASRVSTFAILRRAQAAVRRIAVASSTPISIRSAHAAIRSSLMPRRAPMDGTTMDVAGLHQSAQGALSPALTPAVHRTLDEHHDRGRQHECQQGRRPAWPGPFHCQHQRDREQLAEIDRVAQFTDPAIEAIVHASG